MRHAQDSVLKFLEAGLAPTGIMVVADANGALGVNRLNVLFLSSIPTTLTNPAWHDLLVSLDLIAVPDATMTARRKVATMARKVDEVFTTAPIPKRDWSNPASPVDLGSTMQPDFWGSWRRVPDPENRFEHLVRTLGVRYREEKR